MEIEVGDVIALIGHKPGKTPFSVVTEFGSDGLFYAVAFGRNANPDGNRWFGKEGTLDNSVIRRVVKNDLTLLEDYQQYRLNLRK